MVPVDQLIEQLQVLGMSGYEAKAYTALVMAGQPLNGYEVAKRSGVPRSTVYEILGKLVARSAAYEVLGDAGATEYLPLSPAMLLSRFRLEVDDAVSAIEDAFRQLDRPAEARLTHSLTGRAELLERCNDVLMSATTDLFVSVWPEELEAFRPLLRRAIDAGVDVSVLCFGPIGERIGYSYEHEYSAPEVVLDNVGCKLMVVAADRERAVIGGIDGREVWGTYTDDVAVVAVAVEYVRHDIAMQLLMRGGDQRLEEYWRSASELVRLRSDHGEPAEHLRKMAKARERR